jgi:hypothetical protein
MKSSFPRLLLAIGCTLACLEATARGEGEADHEIFLRYADSPAVEADWKLTRARVVYKGAPATHEERYRVIPSVARLLDGSLVVAVEPGGHKPIFICSSDGARTWSQPYRGVLGEEVRTISTIGVCRDGRLMAVSEKPLRLAYSEDRGKTWTKGKLIDTGRLRGSWVWTGGRPMELQDGTLVVPVAGYLQPGWLSAGVARSTDDGDSWKFVVMGHGNPENQMIFSEPTIAALSDGSLVALMRTEDRVADIVPGEPRGERTGLCRVNSTDGGKTWTSPIETLAGSHGSVVELPGGILLCGYHRAPRLAFSSDAGRSWYASKLWVADKPRSDWGWYTVVEMVDQTTAVALIKEMKTPNTIQACRLHRAR